MTEVKSGTLAKEMPMTDRMPAPSWYWERRQRMPVTWMAVMMPHTRSAA